MHILVKHAAHCWRGMLSFSHIFGYKDVLKALLFKHLQENLFTNVRASTNDYFSLMINKIKCQTIGKISIIISLSEMIHKYREKQKKCKFKKLLPVNTCHNLLEKWLQWLIHYQNTNVFFGPVHGCRFELRVRVVIVLFFFTCG